MFNKVKTSCIVNRYYAIIEPEKAMRFVFAAKDASFPWMLLLQGFQNYLPSASADEPW